MIIRRKIRLVFWLFVTMYVTTVVGCGEDRTYEYEAWTQKNHAMQGIMQEWYLWGDSIKDLEWKAYFGNTSDFFSKLKTAANPKDTWSFCAIDSLNKDYHERGTFNHLDSYGLDVSTMQDPTRLTSQTYARIISVYNNSPAQAAGLQRGEFVGYIDGEKVTTSNVSRLKSGDACTLTVSRLGAIGDSLVWESEREVDLGASTKVIDDQVPVTKSFTKGGCRIGYIMINHLNDSTFKFSLTQYKGFDYLIVDLRLCNDGTIENAQSLASCLVDENQYGNIFCKTLYKKSKEDQNQFYIFDGSLAQYNPQAKCIWFITSSYTVGAAEWVIFGLRQAMGANKVLVSGTSSKGQNVLLRQFPTNFDYTLWLSVAYIADNNDNHGYSIQPDLSVDEQEYINLYPYGSPNEIVLKSILQEL